MKAKHKILLIVDGIVNILLGILLLIFPFGLVELFGLPPTNTSFYASILGAVLLGIGFALLLEVMGYRHGFTGLGLGGAIIINLCGSIVLICWLLFGSLNVPMRGHITLWIVGILVLVIGIAEMVTKSWQNSDS